ncbi:type IV pilus twitching motility protein PilT [Lederbergia panacisoli]|uniref:type IV pilus twitching motility protein PilT n=1 Tax=Lederbergia panacisoli TaxID=1255251 RepID=UPI00214C72C2|nr:type IV pilus twitching motility protein PilT [Lederbergia panacisoli]MCR2820551.1 type IV pilus twitching motility protein PilT [Lederbergia panacisoli]
MENQSNSLLTSAFELGASDLHLTVGVPPIMRINGALKRYSREELTPNDTERIAKSLIPTNLWDSFKEKGEIDFSYGIPGISRFRINAFHQRSCVALAIRVIPTHIPTMEELKLPPILKKLCEKPQGLILVTGPTGSGKSTTLAAMIDYMNKTMSKHIITLEDPIEYLHKHGMSIIDQREVGFDTQSFDQGLRSSLRQDPDVILVGEMRDLETIQTAITAAETGHLVLATLHTSSAPSTIDRIIDVFPPAQQTQIRIQLASVLTGIISQRLFPTVDRKGRVAATEMLVHNAAIANLIRSEKIHQISNVLQTSRSEGMHLLETSIRDLVASEQVSKEIAHPYLKGNDL